MVTYKCSKCGMSVNATCGKCDAPLVNDVLKLDDERGTGFETPKWTWKNKISPMLWRRDELCYIGSYKKRTLRSLFLSSC